MISEYHIYWDFLTLLTTISKLYWLKFPFLTPLSQIHHFDGSLPLLMEEKNMTAQQTWSRIMQSVMHEDTRKKFWAIQQIK